jgi:hypothetical protein
MHYNCVSFLKIYLFIAPSFGYSLAIIRMLIIWYGGTTMCIFSKILLFTVAFFGFNLSRVKIINKMQSSNSRHAIHTPLHRATLTNRTFLIFHLYITKLKSGRMRHQRIFGYLLLITVRIDLTRFNVCDLTDGCSPKPWMFWFAPQPTKN